jgi:hypothetical protein
MQDEASHYTLIQQVIMLPAHNISIEGPANCDLVQVQMDGICALYFI